MKAIKKYDDGGKRGSSVGKAKREVAKRARQEARDVKRNPKHAQKQLKYELQRSDAIMDVIANYSEEELAEAFRKRRGQGLKKAAAAVGAGALSLAMQKATGKYGSRN